MTAAAASPNLPLWQRIRITLTEEIDAGAYPPGAKLPTEAELSRRFEVNRHTVRRALETLREEGRIHVRRGSGAYVTQGRFEYPIGPRTRLSQNLVEHGRTPSRIWLRAESLRADTRDSERLRIAPGAPVYVTEVIGQADEVPITYARTAYPLERVPQIASALAEEKSVTAAFARIGIADYRRKWTRLTAERTGAMIARHLKMPETHPVLLAESLDVDMKGAPISFGLTWFCSDRVQLVVDASTFAESG